MGNGRMSRPIRLLRWPARITYWSLVAYFSLIILAHGDKLRPSFLRIGRVNSRSFRTDTMIMPGRGDMAAAGVTAEEIEHALTSPPEAVLPKGIRRFRLADLPLVRAEAEASGRPFLLFFYCSFVEPGFDDRHHTRLFKSNRAGLAALALRKAVENLGSETALEVRACRLSRIAPISPETRHVLGEKLDMQGRDDMGNSGSVLLNGHSASSSPSRNCFSAKDAPQYILEFQEWLGERLRTVEAAMKEFPSETCKRIKCN